MVAILAFGLGVSAAELKLSALPVVKFIHFPAGLLMAGFTFFTKTALMNVLDGVAIITGHRQILVIFTQMAIQAGNFFMLAEKREPGLCVVIRRKDGPLTDFVAGLAFLPQISFVGLVFFMASKTRGGGLGVFFAFDVAARAINLFVRTGDRIVGYTVIEGVGIQPHNGYVAALMFCVAVAASDARHQLAAAMEPGSSNPVLVDWLVTIQAERVLWLP